MLQWVEQEVLPTIVDDDRNVPSDDAEQTPLCLDAAHDAELFPAATEGTPIDIVTSCMSLGGAERVGVSIACGLARRGYSVRMVNTGYRYPILDALIRQLEEAGCGYVESEKPELMGEATIWWGQSLKDYEHIPCSIWIAHSPGSHVLDPLEEMVERGRVDQVIAVSQEIADKVLERTGLVATVIPNGADPDRFKGCSRSYPRTPDDPYVVGFLGRYATEKHLGLAMETLNHLPPNVRLRCYGAGFVRSQLGALAKRLNLQDRVDLGGVVPAPMALREFDCLLLCSEFEGHPLVAVEAALAGVPVVYARHLGDLAQQLPDGVRGVAVDSTPYSIAAAVTRLLERPDEGSAIAARAQEYAEFVLCEDVMVDRYEEQVEALRERAEEPPENRPDLSELVTVFLISSDEPSTDECRKRILHQSVKVRLEEISGVTPMWRAFQEMHHRCETEYFVQVDADMLLRPTAVADLLENIQQNGDKCAIYCAWLWGDAEERAITGVKIYRSSIVTRYPYTDSLSCDQSQFEAMQAAGFMSLFGPAPAVEEDCAGLHYSLQTPEMAYRRWRRLMEKYRSAPQYMGWLTPYPERMRKRMLDNPTRMNMAIYEGIVAGMTIPTVVNRELDASAPDPAIRRLNWLMGRSRHGPQELTLYLTGKCNHRCTWCRRSKETADADSVIAPDMTAEQVSRALAAYPTILSVCLAGFGEPLMHRDLGGIFRVLRDHGCHSTVISNGVLLERYARQLADWGCRKVTVSLNAPDAERHKKITQSDTWDRVMEGIRAAVPLLPTGVSAVISNSTVQDIPAFLELACELDAEHIHLHNLLPHGDPEDPEFLREVITTDSAESLEAIERFKCLPGAELVKTWPVPIGPPEECPGTCESPFVFLGLDGAESITACRRVLPPADFQGRLQEVTWIAETHGKLRSAMLRDVPLPAVCKRCFGAWSL